MKKFISILAALAICTAYTGCDDTDCLWDAYRDLDDRVSALEQSVTDVNSDIAALQKLVQALQEKVTVDSVTPTASGYTIRFSDGTTAEISNGVSATIPDISVAQDTDGLYYWTLDGEWMTDAAGAKVRASALDGDNGEDGITPQIRINEQTKEWEYSVDNGQTWTSTGVVAEGKSGNGGDSFFSDVDTSNDDYVVFRLASGGEIVIPRTVDFKFEIECEDVNWFVAGETRVFSVTMSRVDDYIVSKPEGWGVSFDGAELSVTAPAKIAAADTEGDIAFMAVSTGGSSKIVRMTVKELRVLTFEDADYKGGQAGYWSSLIDSPEYGGELLYGDSMYDMEAEYEWTDTDNTMLKSGIVGDDDYEMWSYMLGGCAVSNYTLADVKQGSFMTQLSVPASAGVNGGYNGSSNFCVCFDGSNFMPMYPSLEFADGKARVIDHMYIAPTAYLLNSMMYGDGFSKPLGDDGWFAVTATGYDADDEETGSTTFYLYQNGKAVDNWTKWDLSSLGEIVRTEFKCSGSDTGAYGLNTPAYFAFDDVAVRFE